MHELSVAMSFVGAICDELPQLGYVSVRSVRIRVGVLSGVGMEALMSAFDVAADGTPIAGARLIVEAAGGRELDLTSVDVWAVSPNR
jgi:hydrogenase nickel incorporation protein HypA/HybF